MYPNMVRMIGLVVCISFMLCGITGIVWSIETDPSNDGDAPDNSLFTDQVGPLDNEPVTFTNVTNDVGLSGVNGNFFSWTDYNNDDNPDLLVNGWRLFENTGAPYYNFTEVTSAANLSGGVSNGVWGDYDNDGYLDLYACAGQNQKEKLWHNNGNGTFTDVTVEAGNITDSYPTSAAGWGDYDRDGDIDLYVANGEDWNSGNPIYFPDVLYRNNGDGTFTDVTVAAGIDDYTTPYYGRGVAWGDYDNDGWLDVYISNYRIQPNYLWRNNHDGTFTNVAFDTGTTGDHTYYSGSGPYYGHTIGSSWGDMNNDGCLDLWVSNLVHKYVGGTDIRGYICDDSNIYKNLGAPYFNFTDDRPNSTIPYKPIGGAGVFIGDEFWFNAAIADIDNDGDLDVYIPQGGGEYYNVSYAYSFMFRNNGDGTYTDITVAAGLRTWCTYGGAWADYNRDGFVDLITSGKVPQNGGKYEVKLYKNGGNANNWLRVGLAGVESNSVGIGARVTIWSAQGMQIREVEGGMGAHSSQNSIPVEFGLGSDTTVNTIEVKWPSGIVQKLVNNPSNQEVLIIEDPAAPRITSTSVSKSSASEDEELTFNAAVVGAANSYQWDFDGDGVADWTSASSAGPAKYAYPVSGEFNARLTVLDPAGMMGAYDSTTYVTVSNADPTADAGEDVTVWEDDVVTLNGSASTDTPSDLAKLYYRWDFDDGSPVSDWSRTYFIEHTYTEMGVYDVTLTVKDDDDALSADTVRVTAYNKPPEADAGPDRVAAEDQEVLLAGTWNDTVSDLPYMTFKWDFGDGDNTGWITDWNATRTYDQAGVYTVTFSARDGQDITTDTANITVYNPVPVSHVMDNKSVKEDEEVVFKGWGSDNPSDVSGLDYYWDFGDGSGSGWLTANINSTKHTYTEAGVYNATLIVRDKDKARGNGTVVITVSNVAPDVKAGADLAGDEDEVMTLTGTGSDTLSDMALLEYRWDFGDGEEQLNWSTEPDAEHIYTNKGVYEAVLKIRDDDMAEDEDSLFITVKNVAPTADASADETKIDENGIVQFSAAKSSDTASDASSLNYSWDFGDDETAYGITASHRYLDEGSYSATLTVIDDDDDRDGDTITISVSNVRPTAVMMITGAGEVDAEIKFDGSGTTDTPNDMPTLNYLWDFGDGNTSMGINTTHSYSQDGTFTVKLTVRDNNGAVHTVFQPLEITGGPVVEQESETSETTFSLFGILAIIGGVTILAIIMVIIIIVVVKPRGKKTAPAAGAEMPGGYPAEAMLQAPVEGQLVEGEMVTIPPYMQVAEGEVVSALPPAEAEVKAPFCGQCGSPQQYDMTTGTWICASCTPTVPEEEVSKGEPEEEPEEPPQEPAEAESVESEQPEDEVQESSDVTTDDEQLE